MYFEIFRGKMTRHLRFALKYASRKGGGSSWMKLIDKMYIVVEYRVMIPCNKLHLCMFRNFLTTTFKRTSSVA